MGAMAVSAALPAGFSQSSARLYRLDADHTKRAAPEVLTPSGGAITVEMPPVSAALIVSTRA